MAFIVSKNSSRLLFRPYLSKLPWDANVNRRIVLRTHLQLYSSWLSIWDLCRSSLDVYETLRKVDEQANKHAVMSWRSGCNLSSIVVLVHIKVFLDTQRWSVRINNYKLGE
jgi:hypothetical protein